MPVLPSGFSGGGNGVFTTAGSDPSLVCPTELTSTDDNLWVDVQVSDYSAAPAGTSLRLWPSAPGIVQAPNGDPTISMSATAFTLSQSCTLNRIWMNNPPGSTGMATRVGIWNTETKTEIAGTDNASPTGWFPEEQPPISATMDVVDYTSATIVLPAGNCAISFFDGDGKFIYRDNHNYAFAGTIRWSRHGRRAGWNGITAAATSSRREHREQTAARLRRRQRHQTQAGTLSAQLGRLDVSRSVRGVRGLGRDPLG